MRSAQTTTDTTSDSGTVGRELRSLEGELVLLIAEQARRVPPMVMAAAAVIAFLISRDMGVIFPLLWFAVVAVSTYFHARLVVGLPRKLQYSDNRKLTLAAISFTLHGALMASVMLAFPHVSVTIQAVLTIYCVGLATATVPATAGFSRIIKPYTFVTMGPIGFVWALPLQANVSLFERLAMLGLTVAYLATMWGHAKGTFQLFVDSHRMRLERLTLNQQLRAALTQAESASVAKTRFLASASHDLRQPMHALALFSGSLALRPLDARTAAIAEQIDKTIQVLGTQLDALLDISRLDAGVVEIKPALIDLRLMLEQLADEFRPLVVQKGLKLSLQVDQSLRVQTDPLLLKRILGNLLANAIKYTESGEVEIVLAAHGSRVFIKLRDTGPGIPAEEHQRIFEEFYQLNNPERDRSKGLGLGLAIVSRLVELLQINLRLHSAVGIGSSFELDLPMASVPAPAPIELTPLSLAPLPPGLRLLVVDDEESIRLGMSTLLEEMGFRVVLASSTQSALTAVQGFTPDIVLADFRLQGEDNGMRTIEALRQQWPVLPAVLISGDTAPDRLQKAHAAGITLIHKPVQVGALRKAILEAVAA